MIDTFRAAHGLADDAVSVDELARAEALALAKFATPAWTAIVP
jgi:lipoate-protein ligase A